MVQDIWSFRDVEFWSFRGFGDFGVLGLSEAWRFGVFDF